MAQYYCDHCEGVFRHISQLQFFDTDLVCYLCYEKLERMEQLSKEKSDENDT
jgi:hypothetical protein